MKSLRIRPDVAEAHYNLRPCPGEDARPAVRCHRPLRRSAASQSRICRGALQPRRHPREDAAGCPRPSFTTKKHCASSLTLPMRTTTLPGSMPQPAFGGGDPSTGNRRPARPGLCRNSRQSGKAKSAIPAVTKFNGGLGITRLPEPVNTDRRVGRVIPNAPSVSWACLAKVERHFGQRRILSFGEIGFAIERFAGKHAPHA